MQQPFVKNENNQPVSGKPLYVNKLQFGKPFVNQQTPTPTLIKLTCHDPVNKLCFGVPPVHQKTPTPPPIKLTHYDPANA